MNTPFEELEGKTLSKIDVIKDGEYDNEIVFHCVTGEQYNLYHDRDCCESVVIEDINGDMDDLIGVPILLAEQVSQNEYSEDDLRKLDDSVDILAYEHHTWTFYKLATNKGYVDIRWLGISNGYYSEEVSFARID